MRCGFSQLIALAIASTAIGLTDCQVYDDRLLGAATSSAVIGSAGEASEPAAGSGGTEASGTTAPSPDEVTRCGDGLITGPEKCDLAIDEGTPGACPTSCPALSMCTRRALNGTACQSECVVLEAVCQDGDGCCPGNCNNANDSDCSSSCGNGRVEVDHGETCEPDSTVSCRRSDAECDDGDPCTEDRLAGSAHNCNAACSHIPITSALSGDACCPSGANANVDSDCTPRCGNGVREPGEECDDTTTCDPLCKRTVTTEQLSCLASVGEGDECARCSCLNCTEQYSRCHGNANGLCEGVIACSAQKNCVGRPCFCGISSVCAPPLGPCQTEIFAAAGSNDPSIVASRFLNPNTSLGLAYAVDKCRISQCRDVCRPGAAQ